MLPSTDTHEFVELPLEENEVCANFAVKVEDDSMAPLLCSGDILLSKMKRWVEHKELGVFLIDGNMYVKRYFHKGDDYRLISLDLDIDDLIISNPDDLDKIICLGSVLKVLHPGEYKTNEI